MVISLFQTCYEQSCQIDRAALERLTRYCARLPFSSGRLGQLDEHTVAYNLPRPTQDGRTCLLIPSQLCKPRYITVSFW
jgi:hypothetical protein